MLTLKQTTMLGGIPGDWEVKSLKELLYSDLSGDWGDDSGQHLFPVLRSTNLTSEGKLNLSDIARRALRQEKGTALALRRGDILLERSGGGPDQPVGRVGFIESDMPGHAFSNFLHRLRPDRDVIDARFLAWVLHDINRTGRVLRLEQQTTQMRNLNFREYLTMLLPVPPTIEQTAIACALDAVGDAVSSAANAVAKASAFKVSLLNDLMSRCSKQHALVGLGEHIALGPTNGLYRPESDYGVIGTPIVRIDSFDDGSINKIADLRRVSLSETLVKRFALKKSEILINRVNALSHVGKAVIVPAISEPTVFESNMMRLQCGLNLRPGYLLLVLRSNIARRHWLSRAKAAVNQVSINQRDVKALRIPLPNAEEQKALEAAVSAADRVHRLHSERHLQLKTLKQSLMHDLLTGTVRIDPALFAA